MPDISKFKTADNTEYSLKDAVARSGLEQKADKVSSATNGNFASLDSNGNLADSGKKPSDYMEGMTILSYGNSTWNDFISAYNKSRAIYCRASSNTNPATGSQNRMALMACVDDVSSPTEVEFQYYYSVSSHSASQQGDQIYIYKLTSSGTWTVTVRESYTEIEAGTGLTSSYSNGQLTLSGETMTGATSSTDGAAGLVPTPEAGDEEKFLRGDGFWATVSGGSNSTAFSEYEISIATTDWSSSSPYTYTWRNSAVISNCLIDVYYRNGIVITGDLQYAKVSGGIQFTVSEVPTSSLPLTIRVISNTEALVVPDMTGATSSADGVRGLVPAPLSGDEDKFLKGDGTWGAASGLPAVTSSDNGKMLMVVNGAWALVTIDNASGVIY